MTDLQKELGRLGRAYAASIGARHAARFHIALLALAATAAFVSRAVRPLPLLRNLEGEWLLALLVGLALLAVGWLLRILLTYSTRPAPRVTARRLDDAHDWRDETNTAAGLSEVESSEPVPALLVAQTVGRLKAVKPKTLWPPHVPRKFVRYVLAFLFVFCLLAPGVDGMLGEAGAGSGTSSGLGQSPNRTFGAAEPFSSDRFLMIFAEDPLSAVALPPEPKAPSEEPNKEPSEKTDDGQPDPLKPDDEPKEGDK